MPPLVGQFEPKLPPAIDGTMQVEVVDTSGIQSGHIIRVDDNWVLNVEWSVSGLLCNFLHGAWHVRAYLESLGPGPEGLVASVKLSMDGRCTPYTYSFTIGPTQLDSQPFYNELKSQNAYGAYKLVVVITSESLAQTPGAIAAYTENPILQFFPFP